MTIEVRPVRGGRDRDAFVAAARRGQAGNPRWVEQARTFYDDIVFKPGSFLTAENDVDLFVAYADGAPVGRIAAVRNHAHLAKYADATGQFGLLEGVDDPRVFRALFEAAATALRARGLARVTGPFSLTINHETGLLVSGFDEQHVAHTNHAPPFYAAQVEANGFTKLMDVQAWVVRVAESDFPARVARAAARVEGAGDIRTSGTTLAGWSRRTALLTTLYNEIWNWGAIPTSPAEGRAIAKLTLPTSKLSWLRVAEYRGEPIALMTLIPDTNEGLRGLDGRVMPFGWAPLLWRIHGRGTRMTRVPMFGLKTAWHRTRVGALAANMLMAEAIEGARRAGAAEMEISWILETNTVFLNMVAGLPARLTRVFRVYERAL